MLKRLFRLCYKLVTICKEDSILNESAKWPTLEDRIKNKLNSTEEAIRQLKNTVEISPIAQEILDRAEKTKHE